jgi:hypothetical protein
MNVLKPISRDTRQYGTLQSVFLQTRMVASAAPWRGDGRLSIVIFVDGLDGGRL